MTPWGCFDKFYRCPRLEARDLSLLKVGLEGVHTSNRRAEGEEILESQGKRFHLSVPYYKGHFDSTWYPLNNNVLVQDLKSLALCPCLDQARDHLIVPALLTLPAISSSLS